MKKFMYLNLCMLTCMFGAQMVRASDAVLSESAFNDDAVTRGVPCCPPKDNCCTRIQCRTIISDLDMLLACATIPITAIANETVVISESGTYCLTNDADGTISIQARGVYLDLANHTIRQVIVNGQSDVEVVNGTLDGVNLTSGSAVQITNSLIVFLNNLTVLNAGIDAGPADGIAVANSQNIFIENCLIENSTGIGINLQPSVIYASIVNCTCQAGAGDGLHIENGCQNIIVKNCEFIANGSNGVSIEDDCTQLFFFECVSNSNTASGFLGNADGDACTFVLENCFAENNTEYGFRTGASDIAYFTECTARFNTLDGFSYPLTNGIPGSTNSCTSINNTGAGFNVAAQGTAPGGSLAFVNCYAFQNDTTAGNYSAAGVSLDTLPSTPPFYAVSSIGDMTPGIAQYWRNIVPAVS